MMKALYVICLTAILGLGACSKKEAGPAPTPVVDGRVEILVKDMGFEPTLVVAPAGKPVTLAFKLISDSPCGEAVMIKQFNIKKDLPLNEPVEITVTPDAKGRIRFACGMDMMRGALIVQ